MTSNSKTSKTKKPTVTKVVSYVATSPDGKVQASGKTEKAALALLAATIAAQK